MNSTNSCAGCGRLLTKAEARVVREFAFWHRPDGACPACLQEVLLETLLRDGNAVFEHSVQRDWPLDARLAFGALPTPLRLRADPRFTGSGITVAIADAGFAAHPDLIQPVNRIAGWVDATDESAQTLLFTDGERPAWPGSGDAADRLWHGTMTSVVGFGNGFASHGLYRGLASAARVILIQVGDPDGRIRDASIERALQWLEEHADEFRIGVLSISVAADAATGARLGPIDAAVERLVDQGVVVVAAAGNDGVRNLVPPATAPSAVTVGGLDDQNVIAGSDRRLWHGNYGDSVAGLPKPELVAPSLWVAAPVLPGSAVAHEARELFDRRAAGDPTVDGRIAELKLVTPAYQHADGTSFAAPIVASAVACIREANPSLGPRLIREALIRSAHAVPGAEPERQGAGALDAGRAIALALDEPHRWQGPAPVTPHATAAGAVFELHDHGAERVVVLGSWNDWREPLEACEVERGLWRTAPLPLAPGRHEYKFRLNEETWLPDPTNPHRAGDGSGGLNSVLTWGGAR